MKMVILFLYILCGSFIYNGQTKNNLFFDSIDSILNSELAKFYSLDSIKIIKNTSDERLSFNRELNTHIFSYSKIINSWSYLVNDPSGEAEIGIIELRFNNSNTCTKAYSLLYKRMPQDRWRMFPNVHLCKKI